MDTQTTSSHAESGDAVVCNDEAGTTEIAEGGDFLSVLFLLSLWPLQSKWKEAKNI